MAIDYGNYAQLYGGGVDLSPLQKGVQDIVANSKQKTIDNVTMMNDEAWSGIMKPWEDAVSGDVSGLGALNLGNLTAGQALNDFKKNLRTRGGKYYNKAASLGLLNPIQFKQQFDKMKASYMPLIEKKLETYKDMNNLSDSEMRDFITDNNLNSFLLMNAGDASAVKDWANPERTWKQWLKQKGGALGLTASAGGLGVGGYTAYSLGKNMYGRGKTLSGMSSKDMTALKNATAGTDWGEKTLKNTKDKIAQSVSNTKATQTRAQTAIDKAKKKFIKGGGKANQWKVPDKLAKRLSDAKDAASAAKTKAPRGLTSKLSRAIKIHGKSKIIKAVAKKLGIRGGMSLLAKLGLGAIPGGQIAAGALLAYDVKLMYDILSDLAE